MIVYDGGEYCLLRRDWGSPHLGIIAPVFDEIFTDGHYPLMLALEENQLLFYTKREILLP